MLLLRVVVVVVCWVCAVLLFSGVVNIFVHAVIVWFGLCLVCVCLLCV